VKVYISVDMEGVAGISDWEQCLAGGDDYALGRDLVLGEVNAAIDGALEAGATRLLVNDSHSFMRNLPPDELGGRASYLSGRFKPLYMMEGLDASFDGVEPHRQDVAADRGLRAHVDLGRDAVWVRELEARELDLVLVAAEVELAAGGDVGLAKNPDVRR